MKRLTGTLIDSLDLDIYTGVSDNSKGVSPGEIFVAIKGERHDGHDYVIEAVESGAALIVMNEGREDLLRYLSDSIATVFVPDTRAILGRLTSHFYFAPDNIVAVTGTSGKTSVAFFAQQLLSLLDKRAVSIGSLGVVQNGCIVRPEGPLNTLGPVQLHKLFGDLKADGIHYAIMETSSHGLAQHRVDGVSFKGAAFTSFSRDHLDYHKNMQEYLQAKLYLFEQLLHPPSFALINSDMGEISELALKICKQRSLRAFTYGKHGSFIKILELKYSAAFTETSFSFENKIYKFKTTLLGEFQICNLLCAIGIVLNLGFKIEQCISLLETMPGVPGRMQRVKDSNVYIDNSHKPDALKNALMAMRSHMSCLNSRGKLIVLFGCGGDRDKGKRAEMGEIAGKYADVVIITDDNPRSEDPSQIRKEIMENHANFLEISDRKAAIHYVIKNTCDSDFILIAGRGCEKFQILNGKKIACDDYEIVLAAQQKL